MVLITVFSFFVSLILGVVIIRAGRSHAAGYRLDMPQRFHAGAIPRIGGLALAGGTVFAWLLAAYRDFAVHNNIDLLGTRLLNVLPHRALAIGFATLLLVTAVRLFLPLTSEPTRAVLSIGDIAALVAIGVATGILAGLLGVGGGVVMVPAMMMLLQMPSAMAKGTSVAVIIPTAIMGTFRNRSKKNVDLRAAGILGLGGILSATAGGWISARMSDTVSNVLFATLLIIVATRLVLQIRADDKAGVVH